VLARDVERTIKKKRKILGDQPKFLIFFAGRRSCENLQGEQPVKRAWVDRKARGERIAKVRCHRSKDRTLNVTVAVQERMDFSKPAERISQRDELAAIVRAAFPEQSMGVL
jgi:hypothetical protein